MAKGVIRTDKMSGTINPKDLVSLKYYVSTVATAIENGRVVKVGALDTNQREVFTCATPAANDALSDIAIIASEEVDKEKSFNNLNEFENKAGAILRGYRLTSKDIFSVTKDALDGTASADKFVELQAGTKLKVVAEITSGSTKVGTIIAVEGDWIVIEVA